MVSDLFRFDNQQNIFLEVVVQQPLFSLLLLSYIPGRVLGAGY